MPNCYCSTGTQQWKDSWCAFLLVKPFLFTLNVPFSVLGSVLNWSCSDNKLWKWYKAGLYLIISAAERQSLKISLREKKKKKCRRYLLKWVVNQLKCVSKVCASILNCIWNTLHFIQIKLCGWHILKMCLMYLEFCTWFWANVSHYNHYRLL